MKYFINVKENLYSLRMFIEVDFLFVFIVANKTLLPYDNATK